MKDKINIFFKKTFHWCGNYNGKSTWCGTFEMNAIWAMLGLFVGGAAAVVMMGLTEMSINILKVITGGILAVSAGVAAQQFSFNRKQAEYANNWNKKQLAISRLHDSRHILKELQNKLHGHLEILERNKDQPFGLNNIHDSLGVRLNDGTFVFHGEHTPEDIKKIPKTQPDELLFSALNFCEDTQGREIKDNILDFLGEYEFICSAVNNDVFDDEIVKKLFQSNIVRIYNIFQPYIEHLQITHEYGKVVFCELEEVARKYSDNEVED